MFRALASLISLVSTLVRLWEKFKLKQEAKREVVEEIRQKEDKIAEAASNTPSVPASDRLRDGKF